MPLKVQQDDLPTINLTSMIDVVFLLLIFFMVGTRFNQNEQTMKIELPKVTNGAQNNNSSASTKSLFVYKDGSLEIDRRRLSIAELPSVLSDMRRQDSQISLIVRGDGSITFQQVTDVNLAIMKSGIERVKFAAAQTTMAR